MMWSGSGTGSTRINWDLIPRAFLLTMLLSCGPVDADPPLGDGGADGDADVDGDGDVDVDADGDADGDTDGDGGGPSTCHDQDGDYYILEEFADPTTECEPVCGPSHDEVCQENNDCDDSDASKTRGGSCEVHGVVAEAYYVTSNGSGDHSGTTFDHSMSVSEHNDRTFTPGDTIYIAEAITAEAPLIPQSSGTEGQYITYRGDHPDYPGSLEQTYSYPSLRHLLFVQNKQYIRVTNLPFDANDTNDDHNNYAAIWIEELEEATGHIEISGCSFTETVTGILIRGDVQHVDIYRSVFRNMVTSGVSVGKYYGRDDSEVPSYITIGGSRENGNTFVNIAREDSPSSGSVPGAVFGTRVADAVFSYNHVYADEPGWGTGLYLNGVSRVLVEYNFIHDLDSVHRRSPISFKSDRDWKNSDIIIRFNVIGPTHGGRTYTDPSSSIRFNNCLDNVVVYGNMVRDVSDIGIMSTWGWDQDYSSDGCMPENVFIYSNIIARNQTSAGIYLAGTSGSDHFRNTYITNNLVYRASDLNDTDHPGGANGILMRGADLNYEDVYIKNNIVDMANPTESEHIGLRMRYQSDMWVDYNHHHYPGETPLVYYENSDCQPCSWDSSERPAGYGDNDTLGDPLYQSAELDNFALTFDSPCIDTGETLTVAIPSFEIQDQEYFFDIGDGLDPIRTNWNPVIPFVHTLNQRDYGAGWERGAYVYVGD